MSDSLDKALKGLDQKALKFQRVFATDDGKAILQALHDEFEPDILCIGSSTDMLVRAAQRDVIRYIQLMIDRRVGIDNE